MSSEKIENRREERIRKAMEEGDIDEVSRLLNQPFENLLRKDREYGLTSLNTPTSIDGGAGELLDFVSDTNDALAILIQKETYMELYEALATLDEQEKKIVIAYHVHEESFASISKKVSMSDKTVKGVAEVALEKLRNFLKEKF